jgi:predicted nucleic acid-binding protein
LSAARLPPLRTHADVTDAYLVEIAREHGLKLATLDDDLCKKTWAAGIAENPI